VSFPAHRCNVPVANILSLTRITRAFTARSTSPEQATPRRVRIVRVSCLDRRSPLEEPALDGPLGAPCHRFV
jgi:hypothetical protein